MPAVTYFKPQGVRLREVGIIELTYDEVECLRLNEIEELSQVDAAEKMQVHQSTFQRNLASARKKVAQALINGQAIKIQGGNYKMPRGDKTGPEGKGPKTGRGLGYCSGSDKPGYESDQPRQGRARGSRDGQGGGRGRNAGRRGLRRVTE